MLICVISFIASDTFYTITSTRELYNHVDYRQVPLGLLLGLCYSFSASRRLGKSFSGARSDRQSGTNFTTNRRLCRYLRMERARASGILSLQTPHIAKMEETPRRLPRRTRTGSKISRSCDRTASIRTGYLLAGLGSCRMVWLGPK